MSTEKKSRCDARLKTLPPERQAAIVEYALSHSLSETVKRLRGDGLQTSSAALSVFLSWYRLQQRFAVNESTVEALIQDLKKNDLSFTREQIEVAGELFFSKLAIEQEDARAWMWTQQTARKKEELALARQKFQRETAKMFLEWFEDKRAKEVLAGSASNSDKIEQLGQLMFGEDWKK